MKDENTFAPLPEHARKILDAAQEKIAKLEKAQRLCLDCMHCAYINAMPDYSEWTPGHGVEFYCTKSKWEFDAFNTRRETFKSFLEKARECTDFEEL